MASYLLKKGDNDNVRLFEIRGTSNEHDLSRSLFEMSITSELTKTDKALFHVQICPAYGDDRRMTDDDWKRAADLMEIETGFTGQRRAIVLHDKKGKTHAHVVWERYDHDKGIMKSNKFSRFAQDRARMLMEKEFKHVRTPERNPHRPEMKDYLSEMWHKTEDAYSFMNAIAEKGYIVAAGTQRPYMVIDETGRSFNLVRQLEDVKTGEVKERFKTIKLVKEKEVIEQIRSKKTATPSKNNVVSLPNRGSLKGKANDNTQPFVMQAKFEISSEQVQHSSDQLKAIVKKVGEKEKKKQELLEKIRRERLERAKRFRENERDL